MFPLLLQTGTDSNWDHKKKICRLWNAALRFQIIMHCWCNFMQHSPSNIYQRRKQQDRGRVWHIITCCPCRHGDTTILCHFLCLLTRDTPSPVCNWSLHCWGELGSWGEEHLIDPVPVFQPLPFIRVHPFIWGWASITAVSLFQTDQSKGAFYH